MPNPIYQDLLDLFDGIGSHYPKRSDFGDPLPLPPLNLSLEEMIGFHREVVCGFPIISGQDDRDLTINFAIVSPQHSEDLLVDPLEVPNSPGIESAKAYLKGQDPTLVRRLREAEKNFLGGREVRQEEKREVEVRTQTLKANVKNLRQKLFAHYGLSCPIEAGHKRMPLKETTTYHRHVHTECVRPSSPRIRQLAKAISTYGPKSDEAKRVAGAPQFNDTVEYEVRRTREVYLREQASFYIARDCSIEIDPKELLFTHTICAWFGQFLRAQYKNVLFNFQSTGGKSDGTLEEKVFSREKSECRRPNSLNVGLAKITDLADSEFPPDNATDVYIFVINHSSLRPEVARECSEQLGSLSKRGRRLFLFTINPGFKKPDDELWFRRALNPDQGVTEDLLCFTHDTDGRAARIAIDALNLAQIYALTPRGLKRN